MVKPFDKNDIDDLCQEVEKQWNYFMLVRSLLPYFNQKEKNCSPFSYESPSFYEQAGIKIKIEVISLPKNMNGFDSISHWLNENFIIRLFGILDEKGIITAGKNLDNPFTKILAVLRHQVGTHTKGYRNNSRPETMEIIKLMHRHFDTNVSMEDIEQFNLSINTIILPLKNKCIDFIKSLLG